MSLTAIVQNSHKGFSCLKTQIKTVARVMAPATNGSIIQKVQRHEASLQLPLTERILEGSVHPMTEKGTEARVLSSTDIDRRKQK